MKKRLFAIFLVLCLLLLSACSAKQNEKPPLDPSPVPPAEAEVLPSPEPSEPSSDPDLSVEDLQRALAQAGYGWIRFDLSRDGTQIVAQPPVGKTLEDCVSAINESFRLGGEIRSRTVTAEMTPLEKAGALYDDIIANVRYDFRYYSDRKNMPYESMVALGALRDHLAICGGYAQAFQTLLDMVGIENYTVSGISGGEHHMWNYVVIDGVGYDCDPTADRGGMRNHFMLSEAELGALGSYSWNHDDLVKLSGADA